MNTYYLILSGDDLPGYTVIDIIESEKPICQKTLKFWVSCHQGEAEFVEAVEASTGRVLHSA